MKAVEDASRPARHAADGPVRTGPRSPPARHPSRRARPGIAATPSVVDAPQQSFPSYKKGMLESAPHWGVAAPLKPTPPGALVTEASVNRLGRRGHGGRSPQGLARPMILHAPQMGPARGESSLAFNLALGYSFRD
ncbi:aromatic ring-opening dioxygenase LigA [Burkholderia thailandensis]|nr:aromatic ring-opening dioxygenase LigA [Burkholderia thailandensis]QRA12022.1 aromatic ring-opening dioxygenase LigA [Burkholderia thailandensis]